MNRLGAKATPSLKECDTMQIRKRQSRWVVIAQAKPPVARELQVFSALRLRK